MEILQQETQQDIQSIASNATPTLLGNYSQAEEGGNPSVNLATGRLRNFFNDVSIGHGNRTIDVSHIYNSRISSAFEDKCLSTGNACFNVGAGWKLNLHECILSVRSDVMLYFDDKGEIHSFSRYDTDSFCEVRNAQNTLCLNGTEWVMTDAIGNKKTFNLNGDITSSRSYHVNKPRTIKYLYDGSRRLTKVYELYTSTNYVLFKYSTDYLLSEIESYVNGKKQLVMSYSYTNGNLVSVTKTSYKNGLEEPISKLVLRMVYSGQKLTGVVDTISLHAVAIQYSNDRVNRFTNSILTSDPADRRLVIEDKTYKIYTYNVYDSTYEISYETTVRNEKSLTLVYCINQHSCITATFEKAGTNYKTLKKQGNKRTNSYTTDSTLPQINGYLSGQTSNGVIKVSVPTDFNISRCVADEKCSQFEYAFWLKIPNNYLRLEAILSYKYKKSSRTTSTWIDAKAVNTWQRVSIPFSAEIDGDESILKGYSDFSIKFRANGQEYTGDLVFNEIGFAPASHTQLYIAAANSSLGYLPFNKTVRVFTEDKTIVYDNQTSVGIWFTESDVIATFINKHAHSYSYGGKTCFDIIYGNGANRFAKQSVLYFEIDGNLTAYSSSTPCKLEVQLPTTNSKLTTSYTFDSTDILLKSVAQSKVDKKNVESSSVSKLNSQGVLLSQTDEYGVTYNYTYDDCDNLIKTQVVGTDGSEYTLEENAYDAQDRLTQSTKGLLGQNVEYNTDDVAYRYLPLRYNTYKQAHAEVLPMLELQYDGLSDSPTQVSQIDTNAGHSQLNQITYENGTIRTVTNGTVKFGAKCDLVNDIVQYTQFENGVEKLVRKDTATNGNGYSGKAHERALYDSDGKTVVDKVVTDIDIYGNILRVTQNGTAVNYTYDTWEGSGFATRLKTRTDNLSNTTTTYSYDYDGNLVEWRDQSIDDSSKYFAVKQLADGLTQYTNSGSSFCTHIVYDNDKLLSPRIDSVVLLDGFSVAKERKCTYDELGRLDTKGNVKYNYEPIGTSYRLKSTVYSDPTNYGNHIEGEFKNSYHYTDQGYVSELDQAYAWERTYPNARFIRKRGTTTYEYTYDSSNRVKREQRTNTVRNFDTNQDSSAILLDKSYTYFNDGRLASIKDNLSGGDEQNFVYDKGLLKSVGDISLDHDYLGNRISKIDKARQVGRKYTYSQGNKLTAVSSGVWSGGTLHENDKLTVNFTYNVDGTFKSKSKGGTTTTYYWDGNKVLGEQRGTNTKLLYLYDTDGIGFVVHNGTDYSLLRDKFGNVVAILDYNDRPVARYEYDMLGHCTVYNEYNELDTNAESIGNLNPFRWKGYYYETDTELYYINGRFYDPDTCSYVDATPVSEAILNAFVVGVLDRDRVLCDNMLEFIANPFNIETVTPLASDPTFDPQFGKSSWWKWAIGFTLLAAAIVLAISTSGASVGPTAAAIHSIAVGASVAGTVSASIGFLAGGVNYYNGTPYWDWDGAADGFMWGAITGVVSGALGTAVFNAGPELSIFEKGIAQGLIGTTITTVQGIVTNSLTWESILISSGFGFLSGIVGSPSVIAKYQTTIISIGLGLAQSGLFELIEWLMDKKRSTTTYGRLATN